MSGSQSGKNSWDRLVLLLWHDIKCGLRKLQYDLYQELAVGICAAVLLLLFFYIFNDFLNHQVRAISSAMTTSLAKLGLAAFTIISGLWTGLNLKRFLRNDHSLLQTITVLGENRALIRQFRKTAVLGRVLLAIVGYVVISRPLFSALPTSMHLLGLGAFVLLSVGSITLRRKAKPMTLTKESLRPLLPNKSESTVLCLVRWRLAQLLARNHTFGVGSVGAGIVLCALSWLGSTGAPPILALVLGLCCAFLIAWPVCAQLSADLSYSWLEKHAGTSHSDYLLSLELVCYLLALPLCTIIAVTWYVAIGMDSQSAGLALQLGLASISPIFLIPHVFFQIDPKRPTIVLLSSALISLFVATAVFASFWGILLFPVCIYYGHTSQIDRFYKVQ